MVAAQDRAPTLNVTVCPEVAGASCADTVTAASHGAVVGPVYVREGAGGCARAIASSKAKVAMVENARMMAKVSAERKK